jgi:hypothetical protein
VAGFISVRESATLKATVLAMQVVDKQIQSSIRKETRSVGASAWREELERRPAIEQQSRMLVRTARVSATNNGLTLTAATQKRAVLSGGGSPIRLGKAYEFGSRKGRGIPPTRRGGYIVYPALAEVAPRLISLWTQTVMRHAHDALEGKH